MSTQFHIFKNNTDAPATNRGFYFQYLLTLKEWVKNIDKQDYEIYCEVEEDILAVDHRTHQHQYTQIKCYASGFSLNSEEVIKSLLNFYKLYLQNKGFFKSTYLFCATKAPRPRAGKLLQEWYAQQLKGDFSITPYILPVRQALLDYLNESFRKYSISTNDP